jgi:hypothetical protein
MADDLRHADRWVIIEQPTGARTYVVRFYRQITTDKTVYQRESRSFLSFSLLMHSVERFLMEGTDPAGDDIDVQRERNGL